MRSRRRGVRVSGRRDGGVTHERPQGASSPDPRGDHFGHEHPAAPIRAAHFIFGQQQPSESGKQRAMRIEIQQDMVDAARLLQAAIV